MRRAAAAKTREWFQEEGEVTASGQALRVRTASGEFDARRALSCLIVPELGDRVLIAVPPSGPIFVLAILERLSSDAPPKIAADEDLVVQAAGKLTLGAAGGVELASPEAIRLTSKTASIDAVETTVASERLSVLAGVVIAESKTLQAVISTVDSTLERITQRVKRAYRFVEEMDVTRAQQIDYRADDVASLRGRHTVMAADELVKIDGKQIHLG